MMKKVLCFFMCVSLIFALVACGNNSGSNGEVETDSESKEITIGTNIYNFGDNFMNGVVAPALREFAEDAGVKINIVDSENQQNKLNDQVGIFISQGVDVLAINLVDPASARSIIEEAKEADIPLILFNKEATEPDVMDIYDKVWYVGTDSADAGIIQGAMMLEDWESNPDWDKNGDGVVQYVMLKGEPGHPDAEARTEYSVKAFTDAGIEVEELAMQPDPEWSTAGGNDKMATWLAAFGDDIELVICNNDGMAFGAINAMKEQGVSIPIYGVDALDQALNHIQEGEMNGTVLNDGVNQAQAVIDLAVNVAQEKDPLDGTDWTLDDKKAVRVPYLKVTIENYKDYQ